MVAAPAPARRATSSPITVDPKTCLPTDQGANTGVQAHEFYLWHDPLNPNRLLVLPQTYAAQPDDLVVTGHHGREDRASCSKQPQFVASFTLEDIGGPVRNERPGRDGTVLVRPFRELPPPDGSVGPSRRRADVDGEQPALGHDVRRRRALLRRQHHGRHVHPRHRGDRAPHQRGAHRRQGVQHPLVQRLGRRARWAAWWTCSKLPADCQRLHAPRAQRRPRCAGDADVRTAPTLDKLARYIAAWKRARASASTRRSWRRRPRTARCRCRAAPR